MQLLRITPEYPYLDRIRRWYEQSFPAEERRDFNQLLQLLDCPEMHICALVDNEQPVGFISYWHWPPLIYIEHFAIAPEQRGRQLGQQALQVLLTDQDALFVLEVERPVDEISRKRIRFYERQGFFLNRFDYVQPPYQLNEPEIPMRLMSIPAIIDEQTFTDLSQHIREAVYERFYSSANRYNPIG